MLIGLLLALVGLILIVMNPLIALIPGILLIAIGLLVMLLSALGRGVGALTSIGSTKTCPDCRSKIPAAANVCRYCGYRYDQ